MAGNVLPKFNQIVTQDHDLNQVQFQLVRTLNPVFNTPTLGGNLLTSQSLTAGTNSINHGLGRTLNGWILTRVRSASIIFDQQDNNKSPTQTLALNSSAACVVDIYVF